MAEFDLIVVGSGPGGYIAAIRGAQLGLATALVEKDPAGLGGTCLRRGCIPAKTWLETAHRFEQMQVAGDARRGRGVRRRRPCPPSPRGPAAGRAG